MSLQLRHDVLSLVGLFVCGAASAGACAELQGLTSYENVACVDCADASVDASKKVGGGDGGLAAGHCNRTSDCASGVCVSNKCVDVSCTDSLKDSTESDVDCGGGCVPCADGKGCTKG